ncbi:hypothetical protein G6F45_013814 [Rhizopus arrhizus]|nr:hypothetical protein G6F45_013814 [Rhizopus arrhizus]
MLRSDLPGAVAEGADRLQRTRRSDLPRCAVPLQPAVGRHRVGGRHQRVWQGSPGDVQQAELVVLLLRWLRHRTLHVHEVPAALLIHRAVTCNRKHGPSGPWFFLAHGGRHRRHLAVAKPSCPLHRHGRACRKPGGPPCAMPSSPRPIRRK